MTEFRGKIYESILDTIGATPMVRLSKLEKLYHLDAQLIAKLEFFNPLGSVKDRIGKAMIDAAEKKEGIKPGKTIFIEPTSGNTGIALAFIAAAKGYRLLLTMPESMSMERQKMLTFLGAEVILTPAALGMKGAISKAEELAEQDENIYMLQQFKNPANPEIHRKTTAIEIWEDTAGRADILVSGVGTGGTLTGISQILKQKKPDFKTIAVEPKSSPVLSGGLPAPHKIQGIGAGFIPEILETSLMDEIIQVDNDTAFEKSRELAKQEGIPGGISTGAAIAAGIEIAQRPEYTGKMIVLILPSFAERYLSTALFET